MKKLVCLSLCFLTLLNSVSIQAKENDKEGSLEDLEISTETNEDKNTVSNDSNIVDLNETKEVEVNVDQKESEDIVYDQETINAKLPIEEDFYGLDNSERDQIIQGLSNEFVLEENQRIEILNNEVYIVETLTPDEKGQIHIGSNNSVSRKNNISTFSYVQPKKQYEVFSYWEKTPGLDSWSRTLYTFDLKSFDRRQNKAKYIIRMRYEVKINKMHPMPPNNLCRNNRCEGPSNNGSNNIKIYPDDVEYYNKTDNGSKSTFRFGNSEKPVGSEVPPNYNNGPIFAYFDTNSKATSTQGVVSHVIANGRPTQLRTDTSTTKHKFNEGAYFNNSNQLQFDRDWGKFSHEIDVIGGKVYAFKFGDAGLVGDNVTNTDAWNEIIFDVLNTAPTVEGIDSVWNEGDVEKGYVVEDSLMTNAFVDQGHNPQTNKDGFIYKDTEQCPIGGVNYYSNECVGETGVFNRTRTKITNKEGTNVSFSDMNKSGIYTIESRVEDEYGLSNIGSRKVYVNEKPVLKGKDSVWFVNDPNITENSLLTDTKEGNEEANKKQIGDNGFMVLDKDVMDDYDHVFKAKNEKNLTTKIRKIVDTKTQQTVSFETMKKTPSVYDVYAYVTDDGSVKGTSLKARHGLESTDVKRQIIVQGYSITTRVDGGNGTITESMNNVVPNQRVSIHFAPNEGYVLEKLIVDGSEIDINNYQNEDDYVFESVNKNHEVVVKFKKSTPIDIIIERIMIDEQGRMISEEELQNIVGRDLKILNSNYSLTKNNKKHKGNISVLGKITNMNVVDKNIIFDYVHNNYSKIKNIDVIASDGITFDKTHKQINFTIQKDFRDKKKVEIKIYEELNLNSSFFSLDTIDNLIKVDF